MDKKTKKVSKLCDELREISDNLIVLASNDMGEKDGKDASCAVVCSQGHTIKLAVLLTEYLKANPTVAGCMKMLELFPSVYSTQETEK